MAEPAREPPVDRLSRRSGELVSWVFPISAVLTGWEVISASLLAAPTIWVHDLTTMLCVVGFLVGGAYAQVRREHIRITPLYDLLSAGARRICDALGLGLAAGYAAVLAWFTGSQAIESVTLWEMSGHAWNFPMPVVVRLAFFLGSLLLLAQLAAHLRERLRRPGSARP